MPLQRFLRLFVRHGFLAKWVSLMERGNRSSRVVGGMERVSMVLILHVASAA